MSQFTSINTLGNTLAVATLPSSALFGDLISFFIVPKRLRIASGKKNATTYSQMVAGFLVWLLTGYRKQQPTHQNSS